MTRKEAQALCSALNYYLFELRELLLMRNLTEEEARALNKCFQTAAIIQVWISKPSDIRL